MEKKIIYQIYPLSFKDSNNDGKGDLQGIIAKLDYLKELGINYLWICPFYKTPFKDNGYDISDYYNVENVFGTNQDLKDLIKKAKELDIKIMLDMVFNHTSIKHLWFKKWKNDDPEYKDFYIWKKSVGKTPNNWVSKFGKPAWSQYKKNYWYLHLFDQTQADLNWENVKVRNEIKKVVKHYINLGISGFRFDVINLISKSKFIDDKNGDGRKFYTDGPNVYKFIEELKKDFPKNKEFFTVGELSSTSLEKASKYSNKEFGIFSNVFTFYHLKVDYANNNKFEEVLFEPKKLNNTLKYWSENMYKKNASMANFLNNHDQPRSVSRFIDKKFREVGAKMLFALTSSLPGVPYIFQGEEIGMANGDFSSIKDFKDVETINYLRKNKFTKIPKSVLNKSRDCSRTPMQWSSAKNAGFSEATPWIKVNNNYQEINVENQKTQPHSVLNFYIKYIKFLKQKTIFAKGDITFLPFEKNIISYTRKFKSEKYRFVFSFKNKLINYSFIKENIVFSNYNQIEKNKLKPYQFIMEKIR